MHASSPLRQVSRYQRAAVAGAAEAPVAMMARRTVCAVVLGLVLAGMAVGGVMPELLLETVSLPG